MKSPIRSRFALSSSFLLLSAGSLWGGTIIWNGPASGSWNTAANWNPNTAIPGSGDTAQFNSGSGTITLDAAQTINTLAINTTSGFTLGSAADVSSGYTLTLANLNRNDVTGTESNHTIAANVALSGNSIWTINGSGKLIVTGAISGTGYSLTKNGSGALDIGANTYSGATIINAGAVTGTANGAIKGDLTVGDGTQVASYTGGATQNDITNASSITVNNNGTVSLYNGAGEHFKNLTINGGTARFKYTRMDGTALAMTGGLIRPYDQYSGALYLTNNNVTLTTNATSTTASITIPLSITQTLTCNVVDGSAPIDLQIAAGLGGGGSTYTFTKSGAGVLQLTGNSGALPSNGSSNMSDKISVTGGMLLVDNTGGSGTGQQSVSVTASSANATLGGTGIIGGVSGYSNANVALTGSASYAASMAPGTISATTGVHILGTLTVGSSTQNNNVTFNNYSNLTETLDSASGDKLAVYGNLNLNSAGNSDALALVTASGATLAGEYTLATFSGTLTGRFDSVTLDSLSLPGTYSLQYRDSTNTIVGGTSNIAGGGSIVLVVPEPATLSLMFGVASLGLLARTRRNSSVR